MSSTTLGKPPRVPIHHPTATELHYLQCLQAWTKRRGRAPWVHELAAWVGKSSTAVYSALISLEHKGYVRRVGADPGKKADRRFQAVPMVAS
jgi:hypothetical protein